MFSPGITVRTADVLLDPIPPLLQSFGLLPNTGFRTGSRSTVSLSFVRRARRTLTRRGRASLAAARAVSLSTQRPMCSSIWQSFLPRRALRSPAICVFVAFFGDCKLTGRTASRFATAFFRAGCDTVGFRLAAKPASAESVDIEDRPIVNVHTAKNVWKGRMVVSPIAFLRFLRVNRPQLAVTPSHSRELRYL